MRFGFVHCLLTCPHCLPQSATNKGTWRSNTLEKHCLKPFKNRHFSIYKAIGFTTKYFLKTQENPVLCNSKGTLIDMHRLTWRMFSQRTRPASTHLCPSGQPTAPPSPHCRAHCSRVCYWEVMVYLKRSLCKLPAPGQQHGAEQAAPQQVGSDLPKLLSIELKQCSPTAANSSSCAGIRCYILHWTYIIPVCIHTYMNIYIHTQREKRLTNLLWKWHG